MGQDCASTRRTVNRTRSTLARVNRKAAARPVRHTRRLFTLGVVIALLVSYVGPIRGYRSHRAELRTQQVTLSKLVRERDALRRSVDKPLDTDFVEQRARELGFILPGEVQYRVKNIEPDPESGRGRAGIGSWFPPVA